MIRTVLASLLTLSLFAPASAANDRFPHSSLVGKVVAQVDPSAALGGVEIMLAGGLDRQTQAQDGYAALLAEVVARTPVTVPAAGSGGKLPLRDAVATLGAGFDAAVEPQYARFYVEGRPEALVSALGLLASAVAAPDFSPGALRAAKAAIRARITDASQNPVGVVSAMLRRSYYTGSRAGNAPSGAVAAVANASPDDLRAFWNATYKKGGASLSGAGRIDAPVAAAAQSVVDGLPSGDVAPVVLSGKAMTDPPMRMMTHRDVSLPWIGLGFAAPAAGNRDFAPMLIASSMIGSLGGDGGITTQPVALRPINAVYQFNVQPANIVVYANGDTLGATSGVREIFAITELLSTRPLDASTLDRYRTLAIGQFVTGNVSLEDRASLIGQFARQGLDPDYANTLLAALEAVTPADIQRVAKAYLAKYAVALVLPRPSPGVLRKP